MLDYKYIVGPQVVLYSVDCVNVNRKHSSCLDVVKEARQRERARLAAPVLVCSFQLVVSIVICARATMLNVWVLVPQSTWLQ